MYIQIYHVLLCHIFFTYFIVQMLYPFIRYFQWISSSCPVFIIISICAHSHGNVKHWWHSSESINGYMVTFTKIWYLGRFCSFYEIEVSVMWDVTWCLYRLYFYCQSWVSYFMLFYVICCHVYNIYWTHHVEFLSIYDVLQESYISMYMCICTSLWYFVLW